MQDPTSYSPLALAFLGDAVFSLAVRTIQLSFGNRQAARLHSACAAIVCAPAQAAIAEAVQDLLTEEEAGIYRRGRNASPNHMAKNSTAGEYMKATGLEALCGWLYLRDENRRMMEIVRTGMERTGLAEARR
jgi:ribonuclease-3 family protein